MEEKKEILSDGELNPGLPRDRRGYLPLYYLRFTERVLKFSNFTLLTPRTHSIYTLLSSRMKTQIPINTKVYTAYSVLEQI